MSSASRHFQMLGSLHANNGICQQHPILPGAHNLVRAYQGAFIGQMLRRHVGDTPNTLSKGKASNIKPVGIFNAPAYAAGDVYRPKRANQHSKNIEVTGYSDKHVKYSQGDKHGMYATPQEFAAMIGRKMS